MLILFFFSIEDKGTNGIYYQAGGTQGWKKSMKDEESEALDASPEALAKENEVN